MWQELKIAGMHLRKDLEEPRVWGVFFLVFVQMCTKSVELKGVAAADGYGLNIFSFLPLLFGGRLGFSRVLTMFGAVFLFCHAPFLEDNQKFVLMRTKKEQWNKGTLWYLWIFSFLYILLAWGSAILGAVPYIGISDDWGTVVERLAITHQTTGLIIDDSMMVKYSVLEAWILEFVILWLSVVFLGVTSYMAGLFFSGKAGSVVGSVLVILDGISLNLPENLRIILFHVSPVSLQQIWCLDTSNITYYPSPAYAVGYLAVLCVVLSILCIVLFPKAELDSRT